MKRTLTNVWDAYKHSFNHLLSLRALWIILADSGFYFAFFLLSSGMTSVITAISSGIKPGLLEDAAKMYMIKVLAAIIALVLITWTVWTISRAIVWQLLSEKRFSKNAWARFFGFNLVWTIIMSLPIYALIRYDLTAIIPGVMPSKSLMAMHIALIAAIAYFGYNVFYAFIKEQKVFAAYKAGLKRAFTDIGYQLPAFLALGLTIAAIGLLNPLIDKLPDALGLGISFILFFGSLTWAKIYYYDVLDLGARGQKKKQAAVKKPAEKKPRKAPAPKRQKKRAKKP